MNGDQLLLVTSGRAWREEDSYENGCLPDTALDWQLEIPTPSILTVAELAGHFGFPLNNDDWEIMEQPNGDITLSYARTEDEYDEPLDAEDPRWLKWKRGEVTLYYASYSFRVQFVERVWTPTEDEAWEVLFGRPRATQDKCKGAGFRRLTLTP